MPSGSSSDEEQIVGVLDAGAEQIGGPVRTLLHRQRDVDDLGIGGEGDVGDRVQRVLDGAARVRGEGLDDDAPDALPVRIRR